MELILASKSKRRIEILEKEGFIFKVIESNIKENDSVKYSPYSTVISLAFQKGIYVANKFPKDIVLSADTVVVFNNKIIGKPKNIHDARNILKSLSGKSHQVITAYSIICLDKNIKRVNYEVSNVKFKNLDDNLIESYINTNEPYDKAGGYNIIETGKLFVEYYNGDINNIIGLPINSIKPFIENILGGSIQCHH